jgi:anti-sigma regulatory factor (Ser/Thr protein kinase)
MLSDVASQIVHDLRSPVDTLKYLSNQITYTNTDSHSLFKRCISQIESISSELINSKNVTSIDSYHEKNIISLDLCYLLKKEIESKSTLFNIDLIKLGLKITTINAYVKINPYRIKNILNNIINNSIESINQNGEILVSLEIKNEFVIIKISDTGKGFPEQVIHSLGKKPITVGKDGGNGIGLYSAYNYLTAIGGELEIKNNEQGAEVNILILLDKQVSSSQKTPEDIVPYILLDDSQLVLDTWKLRAIEKSINFHGFSHIEPFMVFIRDIDIRSKIYIDSDLGNGLKGEEVAREIYNQGYKNLYIATGFESNKFKELKFLKGVIGKVPPF